MSVAILEADTIALAFDADADTTVEKDVFNGPCTLKSLAVKNSQANDEYAYVWIFDHADPTLGTTAPKMVWRVEKYSTGQKNSGYADIPLPGDGIVISTALSVAMSNDNAGTTPPTSADVKLTLGAVLP